MHPARSFAIALPFATFALVASWLGCSSTPVTAGPLDAGVDATARVDAAPTLDASACPDDAPTTGTACDTESTCRYGDAGPLGLEGEAFDCTRGVWCLAVIEHGYSPAWPACPLDVPVEGTSCSPADGTDCSYPCDVDGSVNFINWMTCCGGRWVGQLDPRCHGVEACPPSIPANGSTCSRDVVPFGGCTYDCRDGGLMTTNLPPFTTTAYCGGLSPLKSTWATDCPLSDAGAD